MRYKIHMHELISMRGNRTGGAGINITTVKQSRRDDLNNVSIVITKSRLQKDVLNYARIQKISKL